MLRRTRGSAPGTAPCVHVHARRRHDKQQQSGRRRPGQKHHGQETGRQQQRSRYEIEGLPVAAATQVVRDITAGRSRAAAKPEYQAQPGPQLGQRHIETAHQVTGQEPDNRIADEARQPRRDRHVNKRPPTRETGRPQPVAALLRTPPCFPTHRVPVPQGKSERSPPAASQERRR